MLKDLDEMEFGEMLDFIVSYNNANSGKPKSNVRNATQEDFDRF